MSLSVSTVVDKLESAGISDSINVYLGHFRPCDIRRSGAALSPRRPKYGPRPRSVGFMVDTAVLLYQYHSIDAPFSHFIDLPPTFCNLTN